MNIHILREKATSLQIQEMLAAFPDMRMIKIVVDIENEILAGEAECTMSANNFCCRKARPRKPMGRKLVSR